MSCIICGRNSCCASFHSLEQQQFFADAETAYDEYLDVRARCQREYEESTQDEDEEE